MGGVPGGSRSERGAVGCVRPQRNSSDIVRWEVIRHWTTDAWIGKSALERGGNVPLQVWKPLRGDPGNVSFSWIFLGNVLHVSSALPAFRAVPPLPRILLEFCSSLDEGNPRIRPHSVIPQGWLRFPSWIWALALPYSPAGMSIIQPGCIRMLLIIPRSCRTALIQEKSRIPVPGWLWGCASPVWNSRDSAWDCLDGLPLAPSPWDALEFLCWSRGSSWCFGISTKTAGMFGR